MTRLHDKVALITGAASGIGAATAKLFAREGAKMIIADIKPQAAEQVAASICSDGGDAIAIATDISNSQQVQTLFEKAIDVYGCLDILHCNAGVLMVGSADTPSDEHWYKTLAVNLTGTYLCVKYALPLLKQNKNSNIIITASVSGLMGEADLMAYDTVKGGLVNLTR
jgi:meso-butanediol dehydrogenase / (S,S)-butanediol dehydrogenase / diacetyl reductase